MFLGKKDFDELRQTEKSRWQEVIEVKKQLQEYIQSTVQDIKYIASCVGRRAEEQEKISARFAQLSQLLLDVIAKEYRHGTAIIYDETDPRNLRIVKNGEVINLDGATHVSFDFYPGEFPTFQVERK